MPGGTGRPVLVISARFGPLAAQQVLHFSPPFGLTITNDVDDHSAS